MSCVFRPFRRAVGQRAECWARCMLDQLNLNTLIEARMSNSITLVNNESSERFRAKLLRAGESYGLKDVAVWHFADLGVQVEHLETENGSADYCAQYFLKTLTDGPPRAINLGGKSSSLWLTEDNHAEILSWAASADRAQGELPPPSYWSGQPDSTALAVDLASVGQRRVTIYSSAAYDGMYGIVPIKCKWVAVFKQRYAQHEDALRVIFVPMGKRSTRGFYCTPLHDLVILLGWGHPDMVKNFKIEEPDREPRYITYDMFRGDAPLDEFTRTSSNGDPIWVRFDMYQSLRQVAEFQQNLSRYVRELPLTHVLLDAREEVPFGSIEESRIPILFPDGRRRLAALGTTERKYDARFAPSVFISYHHNGDAKLRDLFERQFGRTMRSASIYPGEIAVPVSDAAVKRVMRERVSGCDTTMVIVGHETFGRRWVDWEIRSALDPRINGGRKSLHGVLSPELSPRLGEISDAVAAARETARSRVLTTSDDLNRTFLERFSFALPARLLDNLISGYAAIHAWPESEKVVESILLPVPVRESLASNSRPSQESDLSN